MNNESTFQNINDLTDFSTQMSFLGGLLTLLLAFIAGVFLRYLFNKYSNTFTSKVSLGNTLLLLTISVASIIAVVKSSLALSLGLVGALSVVRFRTAIKEPYNLVFLLLSICLGISIGATQYLFAFMVCVAALLSLIYLSKSSTNNKSKFFSQNNNLMIDEIDTIQLTLPSNFTLIELESILEKATDYYSVISLDQSYEELTSIVLRVNIKNLRDMENLKNSIFEKFPGSSFSFYNSVTS